MTQKILKSVIRGLNFELDVAHHAEAMKDWRAHMGRVKKDEAAGVTGIAKHWPLVRPMAHPMVESAVNENSEPDYEIVDDGPTPDQVLRQKRNNLVSAVHELEQRAIEALLPPLGKRRLIGLTEGEIFAKAARPTGILAKAGELVGIGKKPPLSAADESFLKEQADRRDKIASIQRAAAQATSDIEDLAPGAIDKYQLPTF